MTSSKLLGTFADTNNNDVVSTVGAQTVTGKKTFDGGASIKGDASGTAVSASYIGHSSLSQSSSSLVQNSPVSNTFYAPAGIPSLNLNAGTYLFNYGCTVQASGTFTSANYIYTRLRIYNVTDSSNVSFLASGPLQGATAECGAFLSSSFVINLTGTKTIQLQIGWSPWSGTATVSSISARGDLGTTYLQAILIG